MADPRVVANHLLDLAERDGDPPSNLGLQKLLFFAHALSLVERKKPLVSGYFEAWTYGPVHPAVYQCFKEAGSDPIRFRAFSIDPVSRVQKPLPPLADSADRKICSRVMGQFGHLTAGRLVEITHAKGGPWDNVATSKESHANVGLRISDEVILRRYGNMKVSLRARPRVGEPGEDTPFV